MSNKIYSNTGKLTRFILRQDRVRISTWIIAITLITMIVAPAFTELYPTAMERQAIAETMKNPAMTAMVGPGYGLDNYTIGAMMGHQMLLFTAIAVAIMSILFVARHTRVDEEEGRIEMVRSLPVGRLSNIIGTTLVSFGTNIILALIVGFGLFALSIESMDLMGSILYGAVLGVTGIFFTALTSLFAQISSNSRGTIGLSLAFLGLAYFIRAIGDVSSEALSMLSPLGWVLRTEVYVNNYWWPVILTLAASLVILGIAFYLNSIRDLGAGFIPSKPGRKTATAFLQGPLGLGLRLQRTAIIAWAVGMLLLGASYGSVFGDLETFFVDNEIIQQMLPPSEGYSLTEQFLTMLMSVIAIFATVPPLIMILKLRGEEKQERTENLLTRAVPRTKLMGSFFAISIVTGFIMLFLTVVGLWSAGSAVMEDPISFSTTFGAAMVYLPSMWMMIGIAVLLIGILPQGTSFIWLYLGYSFLVVYLGGLLDFPEWLANLSPYGIVPQLPIEEMNYLSLLIVTAISIVLTIVGFMGYNKRDIKG
ncbi:ABC transporter permease [Natranaerofaba carboxydovora]|uniref:ABC transporter permease n=1 Tax=Natranaerofaba carboxydovora TaxID=2742683 RepID=UPI001F12D0D8|nr:ABC transporter permease [Natranaerofaba carboxydovora]UMZ74379.1 hypothetical protein ACONDI_01967 [Natranaerofaba carboxydovora]